MKFPCSSRFSIAAGFRLTTAAALTVVAIQPSPAQHGKEAAAAARQAIASEKNSANGADVPLSREKNVAVMVEFRDAPAATAYADALRNAQAQVDAKRNYALAHPNLRSSKTLLSKPAVATTINSTAARQVANKSRQLESIQQAMLPHLTGPEVNGRVLFRATRAYNGIAMVVSPDKIAKIAALPGVKTVHPLHPKYQTAAFSDIDFLGTRTFWTKVPFGIHGENIRVADIDSGLDYIHANFGGPGNAGYSIVTNHSSPTSAPNAFFPTQKRKVILFAHTHWTAENNQRANMLPIFGGHLAVKQAQDTVIRALLLQHFGEKSQVLEGIVLKD